MMVTKKFYITSLMQKKKKKGRGSEILTDCKLTMGQQWNKLPKNKTMNETIRWCRV